MWRAEDIFFGAFGGGNLGDVPIDRPEQVVDSFDLHRRGLPACPFMHGTAHWMAFGTLYSGGTVVISPERHFDPEHLWRLIDAERVTFLVIVGRRVRPSPGRVLRPARPARRRRRRSPSCCPAARSSRPR